MNLDHLQKTLGSSADNTLLIETKDFGALRDTTQRLHRIAKDSTAHPADTLSYGDTASVVSSTTLVDSIEVGITAGQITNGSDSTLHHQEMEMLFADSVSPKPEWIKQSEIRPSKRGGVPGTPIQNSLKHNDLIVGMLVGSFFLALLLFIRRCNRIAANISVIYSLGKSTELENTLDTKREPLFNFTLFVFTVFLHALCLLICKARFEMISLNSSSTSRILFWSMIASLVYLTARWLLYKFVHWVFFEKKRRAKWNESFRTMLFVQGVLLFPLVQIVVYGNMATPYLLGYLAVTIILVEISIAISSFRNFFVNFYGILPFILYFCALELTSALLFWQIWESYSNW